MLPTKTCCAASASYARFPKAGEITFVHAFGIRMIKEWQRFGLINAYPDLKLIDYPKAGSFPKRN
jgi:hypothetical protein